MKKLNKKDNLSNRVTRSSSRSPVQSPCHGGGSISSLDDLWKKFCERLDRFEDKLTARVDALELRIDNNEKQISALDSKIIELKSASSSGSTEGNVSVVNIIFEMVDRERRKLNFILFELRERDDVPDLSIIKDLFANATECFDIKSATRLGTHKSGSVRPLK